MTVAADLLRRISPDHQLLLIAALSATDPAKTAWATWRDSVVFDDVDWPSARLLPILALRPDVLETDDPLHGRIRGLYRKSWVSNERLMALTAPARSALEAAEVPIMHVEALTIASLITDHGSRPLYDIDFCVPRESLHVAIDVLNGLGWKLQEQKLRARWRHHPRHFTQSSARIRVIDSVPWPKASSTAWDFASLGTSGEHLLSPHDAVVHAAVRAIQPWQSPPAQWVADIALLTSALGYQRVGDARNDTHISERAASHQSAQVVDAALEAADQLIGEIS
jgi:hypothetical protein